MKNIDYPYSQKKKTLQNFFWSLVASSAIHQSKTKKNPAH